MIWLHAALTHATSVAGGSVCHIFTHTHNRFTPLMGGRPPEQCDIQKRTACVLMTCLMPTDQPRSEVVSTHGETIKHKITAKSSTQSLCTSSVNLASDERGLHLLQHTLSTRTMLTIELRRLLHPTPLPTICGTSKPIFRTVSTNETDDTATVESPVVWKIPLWSSLTRCFDLIRSSLLHFQHSATFMRFAKSLYAPSFNHWAN